MRSKTEWIFFSKTCSLADSIAIVPIFRHGDDDTYLLARYVLNRVPCSFCGIYNADSFPRGATMMPSRLPAPQARAYRVRIFFIGRTWRVFKRDSHRRDSFIGAARCVTVSMGDVNDLADPSPFVV